MTAQARTRVLVVAYDTVGPRMAGPAIRAYELARVLAREHDVVLACRHEPEREGDGFDVRGFGPGDVDLHAAVAWCDVVVSFGFLLVHCPEIIELDKIIVADVYDPFHLEVLVQRSNDPLEVQLREHSGALGPMNHQLQHGDFFICASERQRDLLFGMLAALNRINPRTYADDPTYDHLLAVVPFGLPSSPPVSTGRVLRGVHPGFAEDDVILLWAGGLYEWFDPLSLIEAMAAIDRPDVKLYFMGMAHPNPDVPEMSMSGRAVALAERLGVLDRTVFFNDGWVPYDERVSYLLEADIGVSTHYRHIETAYAFRTRMLDYLWAGLPILATEGDHFAGLVEQRRLGAVVPVEDVPAIAAAITELSDPAARESCKAAIADVASHLTWEKVAQPLVEFCRRPKHAADREGGSVPRAPETQHVYDSWRQASGHAEAMERSFRDAESARAALDEEVAALRGRLEQTEASLASQLLRAGRKVAGRMRRALTGSNRS